LLFHAREVAVDQIARGDNQKGGDKRAEFGFVFFADVEFNFFSPPLRVLGSEIDMRI
jgi:hypothetical protein